MRALCWHGKEQVQVDTVPDPSILNPRDAIIRITSTAICGSDVHLYNGVVKTMEEGYRVEVLSERPSSLPFTLIRAKNLPDGA